METLQTIRAEAGIPGSDVEFAVKPRALRGDGRLHELDALRGLAAFTVVLDHFWTSWVDPKAVLHGSKFLALGFVAIHPLTAGREAVLLFFVLSGFVLAMPATKGRPQTYPVFITRRVFRIYVPYIAALGFAVLGNLCFYRPLGLTPAVDIAWSQPVQWSCVWQHLLFLGKYNYSQFNPPFWSLVIEMRISILFPFICALVLRTKVWLTLSVALLVSIVATICQAPPRTVAPPGLVAATFHFVGLFALGVLLAQHKDHLARWCLLLSRSAAIAFLGGALLLYWYGSFVLFSITKLCFGVQHPLFMVFDWASALGAAAVIILGLGNPLIRGVLLSRLPQFLGRISYSVYLLHHTVLLVLLHLALHRISPAAIFFAYISATLLLSAVMYAFVEKPAMDLGRRLSRRLQTHSNK